MAWNTLTGFAVLVAALGSAYMIWDKTRWVGVAIVAGFVLLTLMVQINRWNEARYAERMDRA